MCIITHFHATHMHTHTHARARAHACTHAKKRGWDCSVGVFKHPCIVLVYCWQKPSLSFLSLPPTCKHTPHTLCTAYYNDLVVGAVCCRVETEGDKHRMYIMTLGCLAPYRRLGIGTCAKIFICCVVAIRPCVVVLPCSHVHQIL